MVVDIIISGIVPSNKQWKLMVANVIRDRCFFMWRRELKCYRNLNDFRIIVVKYELCVWLALCKYYKHVRHYFYRMISLLAGSSSLRFYRFSSNNKTQQKCDLCSSSDIEDLEHFIMSCDKFALGTIDYV